MTLDEIVDLKRYPLTDPEFGRQCNQTLDTEGALMLPGFILPAALDEMKAEGEAKRDQAYFCIQNHTVYLTPVDPDLAEDHPANRQVESSKGCICDDVIAPNSPLRTLYDSEVFRSFVKMTTGETGLYPYADPLSSINLHYHERGQELGWHFDNSSFATTLLLQEADAGSAFEYIKDLRDSGAGEQNYDGVRDLLDGKLDVSVIPADPGTLMLFRGRDSVHRVTPNAGDKTRMLAVLAYNAEPGVALAENVRMTFYGRTH